MVDLRPSSTQLQKVANDSVQRDPLVSFEHVADIFDGLGEKIATTAASNEKEPLEFCDGIVGQFEDLWADLNIKSVACHGTFSA